MNANVIRLFEHIKLLQRGVELYENEQVANGDSLPNGINGKHVRIGLLGATSSGKTTLIHRLLSDSAGKISSRPETACLVVHSFSKCESLTFKFRDKVAFKDETVGRDFDGFLKRYGLDDCYSKISVCEWKLKPDVVEDSREYSRERIFDFFQEVNKFGEVFHKIVWNHRQRRNDYNLTDLIDIYDLPGFGGKTEHDKAVAEVFDDETIDILVYLIDTSCGIPSKEELGYLEAVQRYLERSQGTSLYWAYEKPLAGEIDIEGKRDEINTALESGGLTIGDSAKGLLDLTGIAGADGDGEDLRARFLVEVLKPYFSRIGRAYLENAYGRKSDSQLSDERFSNLFEQDSVWSIIAKILDDIEEEEKSRKDSTGTGLKKGEVRRRIIDELTEEQKSNEASSGKRSRQWLAGIFKRGHQDQDDKDRELAKRSIFKKIQIGVDRIVDALFNFGGTLSLTKKASFKHEVYIHDEDIRMVGYYTQMFWMLKDPNGVAGFLKKSMLNSLRGNIENEVAAISEFALEED